MTAKSSATPTETLSTSDLMKAAAVGRNTLRFYEKEGLIEKPRRTASGYRVFSRDTLADLQFIKQAKDAGLTLGEIKELLRVLRADQATCGQMAQQIEGKVADIDAAISELQSRRKFLTEFLGACGRQRPSNRCDVLRAGFKASACCG